MSSQNNCPAQTAPTKDFPFLPTLKHTAEVMRSAHNRGSDRLMSIWQDDLQAVDAAIAALEQVQVGASAEGAPSGFDPKKKYTNHLSVLIDAVGYEGMQKVKAALSIAGYTIYKGDPSRSPAENEQKEAERTKEATPAKAPINYSAIEASAWASGYNDALDRCSQPVNDSMVFTKRLNEANAEIKRLADLDTMHEAAQKLLVAERDALLDQVEELKTCLHDFVFKETVCDQTIERAKRALSAAKFETVGEEELTEAIDNCADSLGTAIDTSDIARGLLSHFEVRRK